MNCATWAQRRGRVAYQLDGPTGLPTEGWWYSSRISRAWGGVGVRDVAMMLQGKDPTLITPMDIAAGKLNPPYRSEDSSELLAYAGVDAQYFACALLPEPFKDRLPWLAQIKAILVGVMPQDPKFRVLGDVTCRLVSMPQTLEPKGTPLKHVYTVFAGPKQPQLLAQYGDRAEQSWRTDLLRLADLGRHRAADDAGAALLLFHRRQLRRRHRAADGVGAGLHVSHLAHGKR